MRLCAARIVLTEGKAARIYRLFEGEGSSGDPKERRIRFRVIKNRALASAVFAIPIALSFGLLQQGQYCLRQLVSLC